jgi:hypothetical protein
MATFSNYVFNASSQTPPELGTSLSASNNGVVLVSLNTTLCGKVATGILFNQIAAATNNLVTLSAGSVEFKVSSLYHGSQMAVYFNDRSTTVFTVNSGVAAQVLGPIGFDNRGPNEIRKHNLGYF